MAVNELCQSLRGQLRRGEIEDAITLSPNGQVVIPQKVRERMDISSGDKVMLIMESYRDIQYLYFIKARAIHLFAKPLLELFMSKIEGVSEVDDRGQIIISKKTRVRWGAADGEKIVLVVQECGTKACCVSMVRSRDLAKLAK
ncbi:hypothetical protein ACFL0L_02310 [Patescibacteria group bacterium]